MMNIKFRLAAALGLILATGASVAQEQRVPSAWTTSTPQAQGKPRGYVEYQKFCSQCHGEGVGKPGTLALADKYKDKKPALLEARTDLNPAIVKLFVRHGVSVMPFFRKTEISDADLDAIAAYLSRNNKR
jgi:mono/diheme cytochrome c family protein